MKIHALLSMNYFHKIISTVATCVAILINANAQIVTDLASVNYETLPATTPPEQVTKQDMARFATALQVLDGPTISTDATTSSLTDSNTEWSKGYTSEGAYSMGVYITDIQLPTGGALYVSDASGSQIQSLTLENENTASAMVEGDAIVVIYVGPANPQFTIREIDTGFRRIDFFGTSLSSSSTNKTGDYGDSESCEVAATCVEDIDKLRRATCRVYINRQYLGTGTLINNTANDHSPLIITAAHVIGSNSISAITTRFNFEEPVCGTSYYNLYSQQITGGTLVAFDETTDVAIIRLQATPNASTRPYWVGWSRETSTSSTVTCIHHPSGDAKKVSIGTDVSPMNSYLSGTTYSNSSFQRSSHWRVAEWTTGATEGGSSGSGLFNEDGLWIGGLTGGAASCTSPKNDYFYMLAKAWDNSSDDYSSPADILDPQGTDAESLDGLEMVSSDGDVLKIEENYSALDAEISTSETGLTASNTELLQPITTSSSERKVWALRLYAQNSDLQYSSNKDTPPTVYAAVTTDKDDDLSDAYNFSLTQFYSYPIKDFVLSETATIAANEQAYIKLVAKYFVDDNELPLSLVPTESNEAQVLTNGEWATLEEGKALMYSIVYSEDDASDALHYVKASAANISATISDGHLQLSGEPMSTVAIYDLNGRLAQQLSAAGNSFIEINLCGQNTGLYIVRVLATSGRSVSFKVVNK